MKRIYLLGFLLVASLLFAAEPPTTYTIGDLTEKTTPVATDVVEIEEAAGTSKKVQLSNLVSVVPISSSSDINLNNGLSYTIDDLAGTPVDVVTLDANDDLTLGDATGVDVTNILSAGAVNVTPGAGSAVVLDGTISVDAGVVTGATSVTSTAFVGALTGNSDTATTATNVSVADTTDATTYPVLVGAATGSQAPLTDAGLTYNATTGTLTATALAGPLTGNVTGDVTGNASGTAATVTGAAQTAVTSLGTLTNLTVDTVTVDGNAITASAAAALTIDALAGQAVTVEGVSIDGGVVTGATSVTSTTFVGNVTGNASGSAATVTGAAQAAITSLGTLTTLTVDNITVDAATITSSTGAISLGDDNLSTTGTLGAAAITGSGILSIDDVTDSTSGVTGSIHTDGGFGVAKDLYVGDDLLLGSDAVLNFNAGDVTITHSANALAIAGGALVTNSAISTPGVTGLNFINGNAGATSSMVLGGQDATHSLVAQWIYNATAGSAQGRIETFGGSNPLVFQSGGGNVGIGGTPIKLLDVIGTNKTLASDDYNVLIRTSDTQAADLGGALGFGGHSATTTSVAAFGAISGRKENSTNDNPAGYLQFSTRPAASAIAERMRITSTGYVGIGATSPVSKLDLKDGTFSLTDTDVTQLMTTIAAASAYGQFQASSAAGGGLTIDGLSDTNQQGLIQRAFVGSASPTVPAMHFWAGKTNGSTGVADLAAGEIAYQFSDSTGADDYLTILGNGYVGFGVVPVGELNIASAAVDILFDRYSADASGADIWLRKSRSGTIGTAGTIVQDNDVVGQILAQADDGANLGTTVGRITFEIDDAAPAADSIGGAIVFSTSAGLAANDITERLRIASNGQQTITTAAGVTGLSLVEGRIATTGTDPVVSVCGTDPAIVGSDVAGNVTIGSGATTSCTVTFTGTYTNIPSCTVTGDNPAVGYARTISATVLTITSSADMAGDVVSFHCIGL